MQNTLTKAARMRQLLREARPLVSPGVYDGYSVRLANALLAQPDIGILSLLENAAACRNLARAVSIPLIADADTGQPHRVVALERALEYICAQPGVWKATSWEIVQHYLQTPFAKEV